MFMMAGIAFAFVDVLWLTIAKNRLRKLAAESQVKIKTQIS